MQPEHVALLLWVIGMSVALGYAIGRWHAQELEGRDE